MLAPGARIGSFEVLAPLGAGGMGEVYRARIRVSGAGWRLGHCDLRSDLLSRTERLEVRP
jgi:hypothetical protein